MKKLLLLFIAVISFSCSDDDSQDDQQYCDCAGKWGIEGEVLYTEHTEVNCDTMEPRNNPTGNPEATFMGCNN